MSVNLLRCKENEFNKIVDFYKYVISNTQDMDKYGRWIYGQHPTDDMIKQYINDGYMYCIKNSSTIIATVALHEVILYRPEMIDLILETVNNIDLSVYKDSMSPLIKKDIEALMTVVK